MPFSMQSALVTLSLVAAGSASPLTARSITPLPTGPVLDLGYVKYRGVSDLLNNLNVFHGIQYAAPPIGEQRWRAPVPIEAYLSANSSQTLDATQEGPICVQGGVPWSPAPISTTPSSDESEDCLILDIYTPWYPKSSKLPVIVYIPGGAYVSGNVIDGSYFASFANGNAIIVSIQYRIGWYGFLGNEAVRADGTANAGLLDQRAALEWVQRNAAKFGGDPQKVAIWGAGGGSVFNQLMFRGGESNPPFRAAAAEYPAGERYRTSAELEAQFQTLLDATGCGDLPCLRALSPDSLNTATKKAYQTGFDRGLYGHGDVWTSPTIDGTIIKELPSDAFLNGRFTKVPLLVDRDIFEGELFSNFTIKTEADVQYNYEGLWRFKDDAFYQTLFSLYPLSYPASFFNNSGIKLLSIFGDIIGNQPWAQSAEIFGDWLIGCPSYVAASSAVKAKLPTWKLLFNAGYQLHGATGPYLFAPSGLSGNANLERLMKNWFLSFFINLDPNKRVDGVLNVGSGTIPNWPAYGSGQGGATILTVTENTTTVMPDVDASDKCRFYLDNRARLLN